MAQTPKTKPFESGDVFIREDLSREYDSESVQVANAGTAYVFYPPGTPMTAGVVTPSGDAGLTGTDQLVLEGIWVPPGGCKVLMIKRPAGVVINANALPTAIGLPIGAPTATYTYAQYTTPNTGLCARLGFVFRNEPLRWQLQLQ